MPLNCLVLRNEGLPALGTGQRPGVLGALQRHGVQRNATPPASARPGALVGAAHAVQICQGQQQITAGHLVAACDGGVPPNAVDPVERTGQDQPLHHRVLHRCARPEVAERGIGLARNDPVDLGLTHALHICQGQPDAPPGNGGQPIHGHRQPGLRFRGCSGLLLRVLPRFVDH